MLQQVLRQVGPLKKQKAVWHIEAIVLIAFLVDLRVLSILFGLQIQFALQLVWHGLVLFAYNLTVYPEGDH